MLNRLPKGLSIFIIASISSGPLMRGGITEANYIPWGEKKIYLFGDSHNAGTRETNSVAVNDFLAALEETKHERDEPLHIFWENFGDHAKYINEFYDSVWHTRSKNFMINLDEEIARAGLRSQVILEDAEIRQAYITASHLIESVTESQYGDLDILYNQSGLSVKTITWQDLVDAYHVLVKPLINFGEQNKDGNLNLERYEEELESIAEEFNRFLLFLKANELNPSDTIISYVEECHKKKMHSDRPLLICAFDTIFNDMFDLHLFKLLCESSKKYIGIVAGARHTRKIWSLFLSAQSSTDKNREVYLRTFDWLTDYSFEKTAQLLSKGQFLLILKGSTWSYELEKTFKKAIETVFLSCICLYATITGVDASKNVPNS